MLTRPPCPKCLVNDNVRSDGGATAGKYYYRCNQCLASWDQYPPDSEHVRNGGDIQIKFTRNKRTKKYICGACGQPKSGHVCPNKSGQKRPRSDIVNEAADALREMPFLPVPLLPVPVTPMLPVPTDTLPLPLSVSDTAS